jgi:LmbE family N-acetylglucosaminyl deacetylase
MALRLAVARLVRTVRPDVVLGHDPWRRSLLHPDHRAAGLLTVDGVVAARDPLYAPALAAEGLAPHRPHTVLLFGTDAPDELVDVTATIDAKLASLRAHASQIGDHADLERRVRTWNAAIGAGAGLGYAEAFHTLDTRGR